MLFARQTHKRIEDENEAWDRAVAADPDGRPSWQAFASAHTFPYVASVERKQRILSNYSQLRIGLSKAEVAMLLGEPDCSKRHCPKERVEYLGTSWEYYLEKPRSESNEKYDKLVYVSFDPKGKVKWVSSNVDGLPEIGKAGR